TFDTVRAEYDRLSSQYGVLPEVDWDALLEGEGAEWISQQLSSLPGNIFPFVSGVGGLIANNLFIFIISLFFVVDSTNYLDGGRRLVPQGYRPRWLEVLVHLAGPLRAWFVGQMVSMLTLGALLAFVNAVIINIPNPVALGVLAGIMEFVPNVG